MVTKYFLIRACSIIKIQHRADLDGFDVYESRYNVFNLPFIVTQENLEKAYVMADGSLMQDINSSMEKKGFKVVGCL